MANGEIRLWGDPFRENTASQELRRLLAVASACGWRCGLGLSAARGDGRGRRLELTDGTRTREIQTELADQELAPVLSAAERTVAASAPLLVWGSEDQVLEAGLEHPEACTVRAALGFEPRRLLADLVASLRHASIEVVAHSLEEHQLAPFARLPFDATPGRFLHPGSADPDAGTDLAVRAVARVGGRLTVVLPAPDPAFEAAMRQLARDVGSARPFAIDFAIGALTPQRLAGVGAVLLPVRAAPSSRLLLTALVSGRPVVVSRFAATAEVLSRPGICYPLGGRYREGVFEPDRAALEGALADLQEQGAAGRDLAMRARWHVLERHRRPILAPPVRLRGSRATVVLEAPLFELSSSSILTIETARALRRSDRVDLHLVPRVPFDKDLGWFREKAPDLVPLLSRRPPTADLWLSSGWPPRPSRPDASCFGVRLDWEYGALPVELTPLVTEEADLVVVHSRAVERMLAAAGRPVREIARVPHGVDGAVFHEQASPSVQVREFKGERTALLFVGGLIWRKGIDLLLSALLQRCTGPQAPVLVVKGMGAGKAYAGYHLGELVDRVRAHPRAPELLVLEDDLTDQEMAGVYTACDLLVHPYRGEGFGMPVLEARACGLPVVVTRGGSTDDFCGDASCLGVHADRRLVDLPGAHLGRPWVLEPDPAALAAALDTALDRLPELRATAIAGAPALREEYSWAAAAAELERIAFSVHSGGGVSRPDRVVQPV